MWTLSVFQVIAIVASVPCMFGSAFAIVATLYEPDGNGFGVTVFALGVFILSAIAFLFGVGRLEVVP